MSRCRSDRFDLMPFNLATGLGVVAVLVVIFCDGNYEGLVISTGMGYAIVVSGMVLQLGYSNQLAFSQSIFMGVGAYGLALFEVRYGFGSAEAIVVAVALSGVAALIVGFLITRAPGIALALATLLLPFICYELATGWNYLGKFQGISGVALIWNTSNYYSSLVQSGVVVAALLALTTFLVLRIVRSSTGVQLEAMGRNLALAEGVGVNVKRRSLEVFVIASMLAALGGAVVVSFQGVATPDIVAQPAELTLLVMFFLGGRRSILGAVVVSIAFEYLSVSVKFVSVNLLIIDGVVLLLVLVAEPDGLGGLARRVGLRVLALAGGGRKSDGRGAPDAAPPDSDRSPDLGGRMRPVVDVAEVRR
jgi:branched-chain amino acid transport system permease protein